MKYPATEQDLRDAGYTFEGVYLCPSCPEIVQWVKTLDGEKIPLSMMLDGDCYQPHTSTCVYGEKVMDVPKRLTRDWHLAKDLCDAIQSMPNKAPTGSRLARAVDHLWDALKILVPGITPFTHINYIAKELDNAE